MPAWLQLMIDSFWPLLSAGLIFTVPLTLITFVLGILLGLLVALARLYGPTPLVVLVRFYVWLIRGTPLLVQLFLIFYGLPSAGIVLDAFTAAVITTLGMATKPAAAAGATAIGTATVGGGIASKGMGAILGTYHAKPGHLGEALSASDIFTYHY